ncbi:MAG: ABC transporter ATP-binding protein, partial [Kiritimatiellae bacterium]|nr:ABC transporter ATP-binding protein [Kiritimatiellia bacterium]
MGRHGFALVGRALVRVVRRRFRGRRGGVAFGRRKIRRRAVNAEEDWTVDVSGVVKRFKLRPSAGSLKTAAIDFLARRKAREFTALDGVTLRVRRGETVGIVGENGAGKSTLLSIVAGTMRPTAGTVRTRGTVSSLLELGAGFHPDLTGRENVMLYGAIMGIPRSTMRRRFDEIVEFSGLEKFIDQPVRFYSSGMYVRLGFSVAVQVDPDILLVDEVLAVGDADFQRKCLAKMDDFRRAGKSMVLISHDIATVRRVSDRIAYLSHGKLIGIGDPAEMSRA